ncbi:hypothetical protein Tco_0107939 [Tanacetum coccineum]
MTAPSGTPSLSPILAPTSSPPLLLPSTNRREDRPEVTLLPQKRLGISLGPRYEVGERSSTAAAARPAGGLRDEIVEAMQGTPVVTDVAEFSQRMTKFETRVRQDINEIYTRLDDEQTKRQLMAGRLNILYRDRRAHARTARLMEAEARMSLEAWGRSMDASDLALIEEAGGDYRDAGGRSQEAEAVHRGAEAAEEASDSDDRVRETAGTRQRSCTSRCTRGGW